MFCCLDLVLPGTARPGLLTCPAAAHLLKPRDQDGVRTTSLGEITVPPTLVAPRPAGSPQPGAITAGVHPQPGTLPPETPPEPLARRTTPGRSARSGRTPEV